MLGFTHNISFREDDTMGRGFLQRTDFESEFGKVLRGAVYANGKCMDAQKIIGISKPTLTNRFKEPGKMTLSELKKFIKLGRIPEEEVIRYLYKKK